MVGDQDGGGAALGEELEGGLGLLVLLEWWGVGVYNVDDLGVEDLGLAEEALQEGAFLDRADHAGSKSLGAFLHVTTSTSGECAEVAGDRVQHGARASDT